MRLANRLEAEAARAKVDLEFLAGQMERMINDLAGLKDDVMVLTARVERLDATSKASWSRCARCRVGMSVLGGGRPAGGAGVPERLTRPLWAIDEALGELLFALGRG